MIKDLSAARRYAQALFDIARDLHRDDDVGSELDSLSAALIRMPEIEKFMENPSLKTEEKRRFFQRLYQKSPSKADLPKAGGETSVPELLLNFFTVLFEKNRFYLLHDIALEFKKIADQAKGQGTAEIHSAVTLKPEAQHQITQRLESLAGYKISVKNVVDSSLIGGVVVKIRNKVIDDSVTHKIQMIRKELMKIRSV